MATHLGKDGLIKVSGETIAEVRSWSLSTSVEVVDGSRLGTDWKIQYPVQKSWHGSLSCFWDNEDSQGQGVLSLGSLVTLQLYCIDISPAFSGTALITSLEYSAAHTGLVEASISFQGSGALEIGRSK